MPILPSFRARVMLLARQGLGWEDACHILECHGVVRLYVRDIVLKTSSATIGGKARPADAPSHAAGRDIQRVKP